MTIPTVQSLSHTTRHEISERPTPGSHRRNENCRIVNRRFFCCRNQARISILPCLLHMRQDTTFHLKSYQFMDHKFEHRRFSLGLYDVFIHLTHGLSTRPVQSHQRLLAEGRRECMHSIIWPLGSAWKEAFPEV